MRDARIRRASATDRAMLAMGGGTVPEQLGVLLVLDSAGALEVSRLRSVLEARTRCVPPLRQRLRHAPLGCGGPVWVDDTDFEIRRHVGVAGLPSDADQRDLWAAALAEVMSPLPWDAPLWRATLLTGAGGGPVALVVVMHHVLTDGLGGLALLARLVDPGPDVLFPPSPQQPPPRRALARDAWAQWWRSRHGIGDGWVEIRRSMQASGGWHPSPAAPCSLLGRTGPSRQMAVVTAGVPALREVAHRHGASLNDAVLVAIGAALEHVLASRGEAVDPVQVVVPVSGRRGSEDGVAGNVVAPLLVAVPTHGLMAERLARVAQQVRSQREAASGPPPIATLGWLFRPLARAGGYRWYMNHQRRLHTLVTSVRGPQTEVAFAGYPIHRAIPISVGDNGNVTAHFSVLSYADELAISVIVDPQRFTDLDVLTEALVEQISELR